MTDGVALSTCTEQIDELIHQQRNDEAIALCKHVLRYYPKHVVTYRQMAEASLEKGDLDGALELFRRVLGADPESILAYAGLAVVLEQQHLIAEAAWQLERAYELNPADIEIRKELLRLYADVEGKPRNRLKLTPGGLARLYLQQGLLSQAIQELSALAPTSDGRHDVRVALMQALWQAGRPREAAESAQKLLEDLPFCLKANLILGTVWSENGLEESAMYLQRAQALDPTNQIAQDLLGTHSPLSPANPVLPKYVEGAAEFDVAPAPTALVPTATSTAEPDWLATLRAADLSAVETPVPVSTAEEWLAEKPAAPVPPLQLASGAPPVIEAALEAAAAEAPALEAATQVAPEAPLPIERTSAAEPVAEAPALQSPSEFVVAETEPAPTTPESEGQPSEPAQPPAAAEQMPEWLRGEPPTLPAPAEHIEEPPRVEMTRPAWLENLIHAQQEALENASEEEQPAAAELEEKEDENATPSWLGPIETALPVEKPITEEMPETPQWLKEILAAAEATRERAQEMPHPTEERHALTEEKSKPSEEIRPAAVAPPAEPIQAKAAPAESARAEARPPEPAPAHPAAKASPAEPTPAPTAPAPTVPIESVPAKTIKPAPPAVPAPKEPAASEPEDLPDWLKKLRAEFEADQASLQPEEPAPPKAAPPIKAPPPPVAPPRVEARPPAKVPAPAEPAARAVTPAPVEPPRPVTLAPKAVEPAPPPAEPKVERKGERKGAEPTPAPPPVPEEPDWLVHMREEFGGGPAAEPPQAKPAAVQQAAPAPEPPPAIAAPPALEPPAPAPIAPTHEVLPIERETPPAAPVAETRPEAKPLTAPTGAVPPQAPAPAAEQAADTQSILVRREAVALIRLDQARSYRDKKRIGEALAEYDYIVQQAPQFVADVIHDLEEMTREPGAPLQAHRILGDAYTRANRLPEALERYRYVLDRVS